MTVDASHWQRRLDELARRHRVPGAALAVMDGGAVTELATGVLNRDTGVEATPDSVWQIGSITKVYTTTLVMQLVDEGRIDLDAPVVDVLPDLALADVDAAKRVTTRHLLTHTSGIQGDHFTDTGRGDDAVERYLATCAELDLSHPLGATMSYCNTGFNIAGRLVEVLRGATWDAVLAEHLVTPLGLAHTVTLAEEAIRFRAACGHVAEAGEEPHLAPVWGLPRSCGPAGLICATAADVVAFARMHLDGGVAPDGKRVLSAASVEAMQQPQVEVPDRYSLGQHWGLGWILFDWDGRRVYGHDGSTVGQNAFLRVVPDAGVAVVLLTNGGHTHDLYHDVYTEVLGEVAGLAVPAPLAPPATPVAVDVTAFEGVYERVGVRMELRSRDGVLVMTAAPTGHLAELTERREQTLELVPVADRLFVTKRPDEETWTPVTFYEIDGGALYVHMGARATPKVAA